MGSTDDSVGGMGRAGAPTGGGGRAATPAVHSTGTADSPRESPLRESPLCEGPLRAHLLAGQVIPAHPLALDEARRLDERRQRALTRYYVAAGAGGMAVGVHTTQFAIREHGLYEPVLALAAHTARAEITRSEVTCSETTRAEAARPENACAPRPFALIAGVCGRTAQALHEAGVARALGYHAVLVSLAGWHEASDEELVAHCRAVGDILPLVGFYLQPAVGGRPLAYGFWRALAEGVSALVAIKIAPFDRYATLDVVRAVADAGRDDVALYTGNDDSIVHDLLTPIPTARGGRRGGRHGVRGGEPGGVRGGVRRGVRHLVGGLLGQWAVWTRSAVALHAAAREAVARGAAGAELLRRGAALTDANGAIFDARHRFAGSIAGVHEVLRRQGLLRGTWCLDPAERLSPGQAEEIERVSRAYPELTDDAWVREHVEEWLRD